MQSIENLSLAEIPVYDPAFIADPLPYFREAKKQHPWLAASEVGFLVHEYNAINDLYFKDDNLRISFPAIVEFMGAEGTPWGIFNDRVMIAQHGEVHKRLRSNVNQAFTPGNINRLRPIMRETVVSQLDEWAPKGAFDFAEFAANFPIRVMCKMIGASPDVVPSLRESLEAQGLSYSMDKSRLPASNRAIENLYAFVDELVIQRQKKGSEAKRDLLDELIAANTSGALDDYDLRNLLIFLFAAGYDTSKNMLTLVMHLMLTRPEHWRRCAEDLDYCRKVVEEALRYHSVSNVPRTVVEEFTYRDVVFPEGTALQFILTLSGRDTEMFEDPDVFDPEREREHRHLAFGRGAHVCLGQFLARAQVEEGLHLIAQRIKAPRLTGEISWRPFIGVWGLESLPIAFEIAN